jgi:hypothetical protein
MDMSSIACSKYRLAVMTGSPVLPTAHLVDETIRDLSDPALLVALVRHASKPLFLGEIQYADSSLVRRFLTVRTCLGATVRKTPLRRGTSAPGYTGPILTESAASWYPAIGEYQMTKLYAFVLVPLVLTLTLATAGGQTSGGREIVVVHSGSTTLHAMLWRPQGRGPFPAILLNHGSGRTREDVERLGLYELNAEKLGPVFARHGYVPPTFDNVLRSRATLAQFVCVVWCPEQFSTLRQSFRWHPEQAKL